MRHSLLFLALFSTLIGCHKRMDVVMRHPLHVGAVDQPNTIARNNGWQATLLRADPEVLCFDVNLSREQAHAPPSVDLRDLQVLMKTSGQWYRDPQVVEVRPAEVSSRMGRVPETVQQGTVTECVSRDQAGNCQRWEQRPRMVTRYVPATLYSARGGGQVCFANQGRFTTESDRIALSIERVNFRWGFESLVNETSGGESES